MCPLTRVLKLDTQARKQGLRRWHLLSVLEIGSAMDKKIEACSEAHSTLSSKQGFFRHNRGETARSRVQPSAHPAPIHWRLVLLTHSDSVLFNQGSRRSFSHKASRCNFL